jgi:hypothetical protein
MKFALRVFVIWLMLLATPFQGLAMAGALPCAPQPLPASMPQSLQLAAPSSGHDHAAMLAAGHGASQHADHAGQVDRASAHHCGGMSACCVGAALTPTLPLAQSGPRLTSKLIPHQVAPPATVDLATPERPPRHSLA